MVDNRVAKEGLRHFERVSVLKPLLGEDGTNGIDKCLVKETKDRGDANLISVQTRTGINSACIKQLGDMATSSRSLHE